MKGTPASPAVAFANKVLPKWILESLAQLILDDGLPVPGGPVRIAP